MNPSPKSNISTIRYFVSSSFSPRSSDHIRRGLTKSPTHIPLHSQRQLPKILTLMASWARWWPVTIRKSIDDSTSRIFLFLSALFLDRAITSNRSQQKALHLFLFTHTTITESPISDDREPWWPLSHTLTNNSVLYPSLKQITHYLSWVDIPSLSTHKQISSLEQFGQDKYFLRPQTFFK